MRRRLIAMYYRVSKRSRNDVRMQRRVCKEYCLKHKMKFVGEYSDKGVSGRARNRPALKKLLCDIDNGKINQVLVYKIDRLGRDFSSLNSLIDNFDNKGVKLVSVTQDFNNSTPEGKFMLRMLTILAEFESGMTSKRIIDGLRAAGR